MGLLRITDIKEVRDATDKELKNNLYNNYSTKRERKQ